MIELLKSINENYDICIDTNKIHKLGTTTINDIFLINNDNKKYIVKIYNVDEEKQIKNSLYTQKKIFQSLKITADVLLNKKMNYIQVIMINFMQFKSILKNKKILK